MYQVELPPKQAVAINQQLVQVLETFYNSLPSKCHELHRVWTDKANILGNGESTSSQGKFKLEEIVDTAQVMLEYYVSPGCSLNRPTRPQRGLFTDHVQPVHQGSFHEYGHRRRDEKSSAQQRLVTAPLRYVLLRS
jgi:hypothetical protein